MARMVWARTAALGVVAVGAMMAGGAPAQTAGSLMTDPREIAACLCLNQGLQRQGAEVGSARALYEALRAAIATQTTALNTKRPTVNVNDPAAVEAFRAEMEKRDDDEARLEQEVYPALQTKIAAYNSRIADYGRQCGGRSIDEPVLKAVQSTLVCPVAP